MLAKELSRISRNGEFSYEFKNVLIINQIHFITLDGAINTLEDNAMNFGLFAWLSETEAARTSKRIKASYQVRAKSGKFDEACYGYTFDKGNLLVAQDGTADIVKRIYSEYIEGKSFDAIGRSLYNEGVSTPATVNVVGAINPKIEELIKKLNLLQYEESNSKITVEELRTYISRQLAG